MIAVIDYGLGNLLSISNALEELGQEFCITNKPEEIRKADKIILPGVGAFPDGMKNLKAAGLIDVLNEEVIDKKKPFLGICLGLQLLAKEGFEGKQIDGLGWIDGVVKKIEVSNGLKLPHMGWNDIKILKKDYFNEVEFDKNFYFVHSYALFCNDKKDIAATCNYGSDLVAAVQKGNIFATQFHPEKSHKVGLQVLKNFLNYEKVEEQNA
jgi:glutamine amidotransferase